MLKQLTLGILFSCMTFPVICAEHAGSGTVTMNGSIIDTACSIELSSQDQTIDMGVLPTGTIRQYGMGPERDIDIYLINCQVEKSDSSSGAWNTLKVTFDGSKDEQLFAVFGDAKGVALHLEDAWQHKAIPGQALPAQVITPPKMQLRYKIRLVSNNRPLRPGTYQALIRFKVDYE